MKIKKIVCFGGGNVVPNMIMDKLKRYPVEITGITAMVDNGGSTGQLREDLNVLPSGDIRRHILALSNASKWKKELWELRFGREEFAGGHKGHNFANIFIAGLENIFGDYRKALKTVSDFMELKKHRALPATVGKTQLIALLENGKTIKGEDEIDVPKKHNPKLKIQKVFLKPRVKIFSLAKKAITNADLIIFGPGDLYSSIICCFLPMGMKKAFRESMAKKVLIVNAMTTNGETNNFSVANFASEVEKYIGCSLDTVLYNTKIPAKQRIKKYKEEESLILDLVKIDKRLDDNKFIGKDLLLKTGPIEYDSKKVIKAIMNLE